MCAPTKCALRARAADNTMRARCMQLRHLAAHFETALGHAGQQLAALRQWRNGNVAHYASFIWTMLAEPQAYDAALPRWCGCCGSAAAHSSFSRAFLSFPGALPWTSCF